MKFKIGCSYWLHGEIVLKAYDVLQNYKPEIVEGELYITINSLEDLIGLKNSIKQSIILDWNAWDENYLVIYDDYIE